MLKKQDLNAKLLNAEYAVRGPIVQYAEELERQGVKIIYCNIGNPQALKQRPLTFFRQVLSLVECPELLDKRTIAEIYPEDVLERARYILEKHPHGTGAYTQSQGIRFIREAVAEFIKKRDDIPANADRIILTDGASKAAQAVLTALLKDPDDGFMIPIPQYPLYSASLALYGGKGIGYYIDEANGWRLGKKQLEESIQKARKSGTNPVGIVVINPGNPTGAVLTRENIKMIVKFAKKHNLSIIADEVYQENVYSDNSKFVSFAKVMHELHEKDIALFSLHSVSKGFLGECGHRGGYLEIRNMADDVFREFIKLQSIGLCANVPGQLATYLMVKPPEPGGQSYPKYLEEKRGILGELACKAKILGEGIGQIKGMSLEIPQGAMYAFVRIELPGSACKDARKTEMDYCLALLKETGICVVPGSGFGQLPGTLHFRITFLPPRRDIEILVRKLKSFHENYMSKAFKKRMNRRKPPVLREKR